MGDHTDYAGGRCLPMAVDLVTEVRLEPSELREVTLVSDRESSRATVALGVGRGSPGLVQGEAGGWERYVAGVVAVARPQSGWRGRVTSTIPSGAGLGSSAALEVALALALGMRCPPVQVARACQRAEQLASGVPCGLMDQLASVAGREGQALLIDMSADLEAGGIEAVPLPPELDVVAVHSGVSRSLASSQYAARREECEAAAGLVGPLPQLAVGDLRGIPDVVLRRRAKHVVTECARVTQMAEALATRDLGAIEELMSASQLSLSRDFEVSTGHLDQLVATIAATPGVIGARLTGAGFGGCIVAVAEPGALDGLELTPWSRVVRARGGAQVSVQ